MNDGILAIIGHADFAHFEVIGMLSRGGIAVVKIGSNWYSQKSAFNQCTIGPFREME